MRTAFAETDLTTDGFLGGRLQISQPREGYRAGNDPVLLAAAVPAEPGQSVLELGCGAGVAALCLGARVPDLAITGVELQPAYAGLARRNAESNGIEITVISADLAQLPNDLRQQQFDHVIANPPFFPTASHPRATEAGRATGRGEQTPLDDWFDVAARRLRPRGLLHVIQKAERLPDMLAACDGRLGSLELLPLASRPGHAPERVLLRARKDGRAAFRLWPPLILHSGEKHDPEGQKYVPEIDAILRNGAPLSWPTRLKN